MTKEEKNRAANKRWRELNKEYLKLKHRERYLQNREFILQKYKFKNQKTPVQVESDVPGVVVEIPKKYKLNEVMEVLRKDLRHRLWGKCVKDWNDKDWIQFNLLKDSL